MQHDETNNVPQFSDTWSDGIYAHTLEYIVDFLKTDMTITAELFWFLENLLVF